MEAYVTLIPQRNAKTDLLISGTPVERNVALVRKMTSLTPLFFSA
jgi:hypothetical protein